MNIDNNVTMDDVAKYHLAESAGWQQVARDSQHAEQREAAQRKTDWHLQAAATVLQHIPVTK